METIKTIPALIIYGSLSLVNLITWLWIRLKVSGKKATIKGKLLEGGWGSSLRYYGFISVKAKEADTIMFYFLKI